MYGKHTTHWMSLIHINKFACFWIRKYFKIINDKIGEMDISKPEISELIINEGSGKFVNN